MGLGGFEISISVTDVVVFWAKSGNHIIQSFENLLCGWFAIPANSVKAYACQYVRDIVY